MLLEYLRLFLVWFCLLRYIFLVYHSLVQFMSRGSQLVSPVGSQTLSRGLGSTEEGQDKKQVKDQHLRSRWGIRSHGLQDKEQEKWQENNRIGNIIHTKRKKKILRGRKKKKKKNLDRRLCPYLFHAQFTNKF